MIELLTNRFLYIPIIVWACVQVFKVVVDWIINKKFNFKRLMGAGGMPSSHTAVVTTLATLIGKEYGFNSGIFAIAVIFSIVVMYDAAGVRRAAGKQASLLNKIIETSNMTPSMVSEKLVEVLGHTPMQVVVGAIIGISVGLLV